MINPRSAAHRVVPKPVDPIELIAKTLDRLRLCGCWALEEGEVCTHCLEEASNIVKALNNAGLKISPFFGDA